MKIIAFTGAKGSGKNTAAEYLRDKLERKNALIIEVSFADILKNIIHDSFGIKNSQADLIKRMDIKPFNGLTLREVYQQLGEAIKTYIGENIWVNLTLTRTQDFIENLKPDYVLVTDLRYTNEEAALRKFAEDYGYELFIIKMVNKNLPKNNDVHVSETQIDNIKEDFLIEAFNTEEIKNKLEEIHAIS